MINKINKKILFIAKYLTFPYCPEMLRTPLTSNKTPNRIASAICFGLLCSFFSIPTARACRDQFGGESSSIAEHRQEPSSDRRIYFLMTRLFADGTLKSITENIGKLKQLGINELWISPVHEQTTMFANGEPNNHMYWPSDPGSVAQMIGGWGSFRNLVSVARAHDIRICLDVVLDQAGFAGEHTLRYDKDGQPIVKTVRADDPNYFRREFLEPTIYDRLGAATEPAEIKKLLEELSYQQWHPYLPVYNHRNPEIYDWLFHSYKKFADAGIRTMRIDAYKHIPLEFTGRFMREMSEYVWESYGERMTFLIEHVATNYQQIKFLAEDIARETAGPQPEIIFIDFPKAFEITRLATDSSYGFGHLKGFMEARENIESQIPLDQLVGDITNHDFLGPIPDPFNHQLTLAVSDFFGNIPTIMYHGDEQTGARPEMRAQIDGINAEGAVGHLSRRLNDALAHYRSSPDFNRTIWHKAEFNGLIAEKRVGDRSIFILVSRGQNAFDMNVPLHRKLNNDSINIIHSFGHAQNSASLRDGHVGMHFEGEGLIIFEVE